MSGPPSSGRGRRPVAVIGAGIAGTGAAIAASQGGATVVLVDGGPGASVLATGGLDLVDWRLPRAAGSAPPHVIPFLDGFGGYTLAAGAKIVTTAGVVRPCAGHDSALVDVRGAERVAVIVCDRPGWHAGALARAWGERFEAVEASVLRYADERMLPDADFAARHDQPGRVDWLAQRLREALGLRGGPFGAIVLPPCLGVEQARAKELATLVGARCGEAAGLPGGPAGLRFERGRERVLDAAGIDVIRGRATAVTRAGLVWRVVAGDRVIEAGAVVVATGGLIGGGVEYRGSLGGAPPDELARPQPPLRLALDCPLAVGFGGRALEPASSTFGHPPEWLAGPRSGEPALLSAGALVGDDGEAPVHGIFAAGEVVADAPRTWLQALASGLRAGAAAARVAALSHP